MAKPELATNKDERAVLRAQQRPARGGRPPGACLKYFTWAGNPSRHEWLSAVIEGNVSVK